ncbi:hypothetical protein W97_07556 [Coniosporium apollinis CBS 100218]|uniref:Major facilitator superfamily (MFS) profile domain-containing protein n=1 Tax=Coniosporium apollinis (strain CBS 100218) TaxID=1168221 RepID=R7Z2H0_CONA1|nr:uncharacterized protein W97_07556 [Coniosporium apollinis CBS 100218]EON68298.1 hypothetical protein W97_07556 [Coniosporium apollinis CBS 100218]
MSVAFGQLILYALGAGFTEIYRGWRYMVGLGALPAIILALIMLKCPESPRQLIAHKKHEEAARVLKRIFPKATEDQLRCKIKLIQNSSRRSQLLWATNPCCGSSINCLSSGQI